MVHEGSTISLIRELLQSTQHDVLSCLEHEIYNVTPAVRNNVFSPRRFSLVLNVHEDASRRLV